MAYMDSIIAIIIGLFIGFLSYFYVKYQKMSKELEQYINLINGYCYLDMDNDIENKKGDYDSIHYSDKFSVLATGKSKRKKSPFSR